MEHAWYKFSRIFFGFVGVFQDSKLLKTIFKKHMDRHTPCNLGFLKSTFWWGQGAEGDRLNLTSITLVGPVLCSHLVRSLTTDT